MAQTWHCYDLSGTQTAGHKESDYKIKPLKRPQRDECTWLRPTQPDSYAATAYDIHHTPIPSLGGTPFTGNRGEFVSMMNHRLLFPPRSPFNVPHIPKLQVLLEQIFVLCKQSLMATQQLVRMSSFKEVEQRSISNIVWCGAALNVTSTTKMSQQTLDARRGAISPTSLMLPGMLAEGMGTSADIFMKGLHNEQRALVVAPEHLARIPY